MTRKDYELIAGAIVRSRMVTELGKNTIKRDAGLRALSLVATDLAATLAHDNPRFDKERFLRAAH